MAQQFLGLLLCTFTVIVTNTYAQCPIPKFYQGDFYAISRGDEVNTLINDEGIKTEKLNAKCQDVRARPNTTDALGRFDAYVLYLDPGSKCYICHQVYFRSPNILQFKEASCVSADRVYTLEEVCSNISPESDLLTMFRKSLEIVNCRQTFEGVYQFSYEINYGGGGICDNKDSIIKACQEPGSPYVDNQVFEMKYASCPEVSTSLNRRIKYQCMGMWRDNDDNIFSAIADLGEPVFRDRFKCLLTRIDQQRKDNRKLFSLSRFAQCSNLKSPYEGPVRLSLLPVVYGSQLVEPSCVLPRNFTGTWFSTGEFDSDVTINSTHIYFKTKVDEFTYKETFFTCQRNRDSRYLMTAVTVGKCEIDYVCFDFAPRHENLIRWRLSKPYRLIPQKEFNLPDFLDRKFRQACTWSSFTIDRRNFEWTYSTFILNPPAPVDCPIGGRYHFIQTGAPEEMYYTRIRGITDRPRHMIDCLKYVTEFKSCARENPKKILIDADYCETVDHNGKPVGEYDEPDRELNCVGHWLEDMRSYMITYDEEDAVSQFRCWVYERLDWRDMILSRATRAQCGKRQTARSYTPEEGASLHLELKESERNFDSCPQRYDTGADPYKKLEKIYVVGAASSLHYSILTLVIVTLFVQLIRLS